MFAILALCLDVLAVASIELGERVVFLAMPRGQRPEERDEIFFAHPPSTFGQIGEKGNVGRVTHGTRPFYA